MNDIYFKDNLFQLRHSNFKNDLFRYAVKYEIEKIISASKQPILNADNEESREILVWLKALELYENVIYPDLKPLQ